MSGLFQTEGIVIKKKDYQEADQLLTILTPTHGKVDAIVKGVRKPRSKLRSGTQQLCLSRFLMYAGKSLMTITQCEVKSIFAPLRQDLTLLAYAYYFLEITDSIVMPGQVTRSIFFLLKNGLEMLTETEPVIVARAFEARALKILGLEPCLEVCVVCGSSLENNKRIALAPNIGGAFCSKCQNNHGKYYLVTPGSIKIWQQLTRMNWVNIKRLHISNYFRQELGEVIPAFLEYYLEKRLQSRNFIHEISK
ncbi:MAG: repair protein RecO [Clostridia bacterium]|nr:repair protein RecO [Clostridia bacterium]